MNIQNKPKDEVAQVSSNAFQEAGKAIRMLFFAFAGIPDPLEVAKRQLEAAKQRLEEKKAR